jgi:transposase
MKTEQSMKQKMEREPYRVAKAHLVAGMREGQSWQSAAASAGLQISQSNAYRLMKAVRQRGEAALSDGRHGHPSKLRGEARRYLEEACRKAPQTPSALVQKALRERFQVSISISQINRVRAVLGVSNPCKHAPHGEKKRNSGSLPGRQHGRKALAVSCCWQLPLKRISSWSSKRRSHPISSLLPQRSA